jgi:hypothetical protein
MRIAGCLQHAMAKFTTFMCDLCESKLSVFNMSGCFHNSRSQLMAVGSAGYMFQNAS